ncbi:MAG: sulfatase [Verrucomicrobiota bacterium]
MRSLNKLMILMMREMGNWCRGLGLVCLTFGLGIAGAEEGGRVYQEKGGLVVMEMEETESPLERWVLIPAGAEGYPAGATGAGHLEHGEFEEWDVPDSPLEYRFRIEKAGRYSLLFRAHKRLEGAEGDKCNDCFVRMEGDFESGDVKVPLVALQTDMKLFGGMADRWGVARTLDINFKKLGIPNKQKHLKAPAVYEFQGGETYTLVVSGRSQRFNLDRIVLHHESVEMAGKNLGALEGSDLVVEAEKPNVLFIMSDDHTWQALGCYESRFNVLNATPTLDRLAREGMVFDHVFCNNSICTPSRASIMTGQYSHVNGAVTLYGEVPEEQQYLALEMRKAGYQTAVVGKWHLNVSPTAFDYYKVFPGQGKYFDPEFEEKGKEELVKMEGHSSDCVTDSALHWFQEIRDPGKPFFLKLQFKAPHDYFENAPRYDELWEGRGMPEPESLWERGEGSIATRGLDGELEHVIATSIGRRNYRRGYDRDFEVSSELSDVEAQREAYNIYMKKYFRCVKGVDDNIQRVVEYLEREGLLDNTVIIYTGDQGFFLGEHDMQDKRWAYEPSMRMPLFVRYPKTVEAGTRSDAIVENVDFPVTMLDFAGVERPEVMQGASFRTIAESGEEPEGWKQEAYYQYWMHMAHHDVPGHIAMRTKKYKLILFHGTGGDLEWSERSAVRTPPAWELYDLEVDPHERNNLADEAEYAELLVELKEQFANLRRRIRADDAQVMPHPGHRKRMAAINAVVDEFWDYSEEEFVKARGLSRAYFEKFGDAETGEKYLPPWLRPDDLDPSEQ